MTLFIVLLVMVMYLVSIWTAGYDEDQTRGL